MGFACESTAACAKSAADEGTFTAAECSTDNCATCTADEGTASGSDAVSVVRTAIAVVVIGRVVAAVIVVLLGRRRHCACEQKRSSEKSCVDLVHVVLLRSACETDAGNVAGANRYRIGCVWSGGERRNKRLFVSILLDGCVATAAYGVQCVWITGTLETQERRFLHFAWA